MKPSMCRWLRVGTAQRLKARFTRILSNTFETSAQSEEFTPLKRCDNLTAIFMVYLS